MLVLTLVILGWITGCARFETETPGTGEETITQEGTTATLPEGGVPTYGYTYGQPSGNRLVGAKGTPRLTPG